MLLAGLIGVAQAPDRTIRFELQRLPVTLENHPSAHKYLPETMAGGVAAFDYDGDGLVDLFFTNGAALPSLAKEGGRDANHLFHNEGGLRFRDVTDSAGLAGTGYSIGAAVGDYDNDGNPDLFVAGVSGNHLYRNDGHGHFSDVTVQAGLVSHDWSVGAAWLDYDRDGLLDLFVVNYVKWLPELNPVCTEASKSLVVYCHPKMFASVSNRLFHNLGNGKFADVSAASGIAAASGKGMSVAVADYDGDGYPDLFITNDTVPNFLFHNLKNGRFAEVAAESGVALPEKGIAPSAMGAEFRDYDNDSRPDILYTALAGETFPLFRNLGGGSFEETTFASRLGPLSIQRSGWGVALADFDNDGWKDILTANSHVTDNIGQFSGDSYALPNSLFRARGGGQFEDVSAQAGVAFQQARPHRGLVAVDLDNDGRMDAVVTVLGEPPEIWHNTTVNANHWLAVRLEGRSGNRDGLGAEVLAGKQANSMSSSYSYGSSALVPVHFGLGPADHVDLSIRWPDGKVQLVKQVRGDQVITIAQK